MKKIKITKEQYKILTDAGLIKENASFDTSNPVNKSFKKAFAGKDISNFKYMPEEKIVKGKDFKISTKNPAIPTLKLQEVEDLIRYAYGVNEEFSPYWGENNLTYEQLCEALENKGLFVKKENTYRIPKKLGSPDETKKAIHETLSEMLNHNMQENDNAPLGSDFDPNNPDNRPQTKSSIANEPSNKDFELIYNNLEISILKNNTNYDIFVFNHANMDKRDFEEYAERNGFIDADGDMEYYDDWELDDDAIERYFNDIVNTTNVGEGLDAFESGKYDIVKIDNPLKNDLLSIYDKDKKLVKALSSINETSTAGSVGGSYVTGAFLEPMKEDDVIKRKITETDTNSVGNIGYDNPGFAGISRNGDFPKNRKKTKAEEKTQSAGGSFVEFDDCTKLNNNKKAQNGGCSTGAVDNVVKQKKTSSSINAPSLGKGISEGRTFSIYKLDRIVKK